MKISGLSVPTLNSSSIFEPVGIAENENGAGSSFPEMLSAAVQEVNGLQKAAAAKNMDMVAGRVEDIAEVMIAAEKASLALQLTVQVRNRVVEAYQEIMRMQM